MSDAGVLTVSLRFSGAAGKIASVAACGGATGLGYAWILFEPDSGTGFRVWGPYLDRPAPQKHKPLWTKVGQTLSSVNPRYPLKTGNK